MYTPAHFRLEDCAKITAIIAANSFATLTTRSAGGLTASHLPFLYDESAGPHGTLFAHLARANGQWRDFSGSPDSEALVVFQGEHGYISPTWYASYATMQHVPTWNYEAVHAYGVPRVIEDADRTVDVLERTIRRYEAAGSTYSVRSHSPRISWKRWSKPSSRLKSQSRGWRGSSSLARTGPRKISPGRSRRSSKPAIRPPCAWPRRCGARIRPDGSDAVQGAEGAELIPAAIQLQAAFPIVRIHRDFRGDGPGLEMQPLNHFLHVRGKRVFSVQQQLADGMFFGTFVGHGVNGRMSLRMGGIQPRWEGETTESTVGCD